MEVTEDFKDLPEIVCPFCGSVTEFRPSGRTNKGSLDVTIDSHAAGGTGVSLQGESSGPLDANDNGSGDASKFVTMEYAVAADRAGRGEQTEDEAEYEKASTPSGQHGKDSGSNDIRQEEQFQPPNLAGYQIIEELGRGGMGVVYRAHAASLGHDVALKTLQHMSPYGLRCFKQEFRALADISHPNLAALYELLSDGATWCFTMEILEGVEFLEYVWSGFDTMNVDSQHEPAKTTIKAPRLSSERLKRLEDALVQLVSGLNSLHEFGVLHSDIKPSNVLVTTDGSLVLLDFGLVVELRQEEMTAKSRTIQGTPQYMSPEQAVGDPLSAASDWYAVGVMLYEVLTGRLPFRGHTAQILSQKRVQAAVEPLGLESDSPQHLNDLCVALLDRAPQNRPAAVEILQSIGAHDMADILIASKSIAAMRSVELVGRQRHFEVLRRSFSEVSDGNTRSVFISGQSGMGKSVLAHSFLDSIISRGDAVVLVGRCYEQESVPFKALDDLIDSLAVFLETLPVDVIHTVMPRDRLALTRVFPVLGGTPEVVNATYPSIENADQQELRQRAMNAMRELLQRLAIREPLVLYIDDLQWGDVDSARLLADLVRPPEAPRMLVLGSYRTENPVTSVCLRTLDEAYTTGQHHPHREEIAVESLLEPDARDLALLLLGRDDDESHELATRIARESRGQPFFVWELAQHVQDDPNIGDQSLELDEVIWTRVNRLPEEARRLLELIAVSSRPTPAMEAYQAIDAVEHGQRYLAQLRTSNFVRTTESEDEDTIVETYHDRVRESVVDHLDEETVKGHNLNLALTIAQVSGIQVDDLWTHINSTVEFEEPGDPHSLDKRQWQRVFDIASFFDAAGEHERAFPFALCAAEQARKQDAQEVAEQQYRVALRGVDWVSPAIRFRVLEGLGDVFVLRGKYDEANEQFEATRSGVKGELVLARLDWKRGVAAFKKGDMGNARDYSEKAIRALGERPPSTLTALPRALTEAVVQILHTKFPSRFVGQRDSNSPHAKLDLFRARVYDQLTFSYWFSAGMNFVLWSHLRQMNLAERYPPSPELGKTYSFHAVTMTGLPMAKRGIAYAEKAYQISVDDGDLWGQGKARSFHTFACIVLARFHEGVKTGDEAVGLLEQAGDVWEANMARMIATVPKFHLGDLRTAYRESKKAYEIAVECRDYSGVCISLLFWAPNSPHTLPPGAIQKEMERDRDDPVSLAGVVYARGLELLLSEDKPREAAVVLQECLKRARQRGVRNVCIFSAATWKATALRIAAERESGPSARRLVLRDAKRAVKAALAITKSYVACRPHALREAGLIVAMEGREAYARQCFEKSLGVAEEYDARYDIAKTNLAYGEAALEFGWPDAEQRVASAKATIHEIEDFEGE